VLTVDAYVHTGSCDTNSERYLTSFGSWISAGSTIQQLPDCGSPNFSFELGPQVLRPDGNVIAFGGTTSGVAHTAIFNSSKLRWKAGPDLLSVYDRPGFIEPIDESGIFGIGAALLRTPAHAEIPVAQCQHRFQLRQEFGVKPFFDDVPLVGREITGWRPEGVHDGSSGCFS
jgi:hypothetical protein